MYLNNLRNIKYIKSKNIRFFTSKKLQNDCHISLTTQKIMMLVLGFTKS